MPSRKNSGQLIELPDGRIGRTFHNDLFHENKIKIHLLNKDFSIMMKDNQPVRILWDREKIHELKGIGMVD